MACGAVDLAAVLPALPIRQLSYRYHRQQGQTPSPSLLL